jgi:pimeloyl-ACP methyl ester carboxylesterase
MQTITTKIPNRHGLNIAVLVEIPENPKGLIFIVHGWKSNKNSTTATALTEMAVSYNLTAVRFDCTHAAGESDGEIELSTISTYISDLEDVVGWAKTKDWFQSPYLLAGSSLGGITILEHANAHRDEVKAIAPIATVISGELSIESRKRKDPEGLAQWQANGSEKQGYKTDSAIFPWTHMEDRLKYGALRYAPELTMPVFMCGGSEDDSCPPDHQKMLFDALGSQNKEIHVIEGAPHSLKEPLHLSQLKSRFSAWFAKIL